MKLKFPKFERAKVMVVGDIILDRYWYGLTTRISTEAPVPVVKVETVEERPGGAANVAMNIASLGANSRLVGITGIDDAARVIVNTLSKVNVKCDFVSVPTYSTITKIRVVSQNQQLIRLDLEEEFGSVDFEPLYERINQALQNINVLVLSDYAKGTLTSTNVQQIIQLARKSDVPILIDPKHTNFQLYRGATLLTPNLFEFESVAGKCEKKEDIVDRGAKIITDLKLTALLVTCSEQGMILLQLNKPPIYIPSRSHEVYDVTGAGDTVIGVLAATIAAGNTLEEACYVANAAAGIVVGKLGTSSVSPFELKNAIQDYSENNFGIISEEELKVAVSAARKRGEKIVMTNGVFDILHAGHVSYLAKAKKFGDRLIVAVNSDTSTKRLKGKERPINSLKHRMIVLNALESVDWVVPFEEDTPYRLVSNILPDLLVKGGDYRLEQIINNRELLTDSVEVMILNFEDGCSTSKILKRIREMKC